jgi:hypothetical protein
MLTLLRIVTGTDWKHRTSVSVEVLGHSDNRADLLKLQDEDVERIKAEDIVTDQTFENEDAAEEGREPTTFTEWQNDNRWEMDLGKDEDTRTLCGGNDGDSNAICYKIVDIV